MYCLSVRDHFMIAHSFRGAVFGPAQALHGATYVVDLELRRETLDADGIVADIGRLAELLKAELAALNFRNLDEEPAFAGRNTTTEFLAHHLFQRLADRIRAGALGVPASSFTELRVTLHESPMAWASFTGSLTSPGP